MAKKHEYIKAHIKIVHQLVKSGDVSCKILSDYNIYQVYVGYKGIVSKMERYQFVADDLKTSVQQVMRAVKSMESSM